MTLHFRRYRQEDIDRLISHLRDDHLGQLDDNRNGFNNAKVRDLLVGNLNNSQFFLTLAVEDGDIVGAFCAAVYMFIFSYEAEALDHLFFVLPDHRSAEAATGLITAYVEWAKLRKVKRAFLRNVTGKHVKAYARMAEKMGFKELGTYHAMEF